MKDEVTFRDVQYDTYRKSPNVGKVWGSLQQAKRDGLNFVWIDTCCIDRQSSAELSEAINSMYGWYQGAECCYVYLHDVDQDDWENSFPKSKWFTRGWTLQELLAPRKVIFYDRQWQLLGDRKDLARHISCATGIDLAALETGVLSGYSVAQKMSWASRRVTTLPEDGAYCLMGIFGVNMPLLYGEGERAFLRLQEEIIKYNDDQTIFAWSMGKKKKFSGLLAPSTACFVGCANTISAQSVDRLEPFSMTNRVLSITLEITPWLADTYLAFLDCREKSNSEHCFDMPVGMPVGIFLRRLTEDDQFARVGVSRKGLWHGPDRNYRARDRPISERRLFVRQTLDCDRGKACLEVCRYGFEISNDLLLPSARIFPARRSPQDRTAFLRPGGWGLTAVIDISSPNHGLSRIALGFDFGFRPICLLEDSTSAQKDRSGGLMDYYDWSRVDPDAAEWDEIIEGGRVYRSSAHRGVWALRGHRLRGFDLLLSKSFNHQGSFVRLERCKSRSRLVWKLEIDDLEGPFRNHTPQSTSCFFRQLQEFQAACGLTMTEEDSEQGDAILETMYPPVVPC